MKGLTDIPGIKVGHASDFEGITGCTVVLCEAGAVPGYDIRGGATGTVELDAMSPGHVAPVVHAVVLAGGSAFGLEAAGGVRRILETRGIGFKTSAAVVPIVPGAILYDLSIGKASARPTREMGEAATVSASDRAVQEGNIGAGTGATCGKLLGMKQAMKGGLGSATVELGGANAGVLVSALVAANPFGDILDPSAGKILAGARKSPTSRDFAGSADLMLRQGAGPGEVGRANTTLAIVATNARLTKVGATRLAQMAQQGLVRAISPVHTTVDGDIAIALSCGTMEAPVDALGVAAAEAVARAIVRAARAAKTLGGVPGLAG